MTMKKRVGVAVVWITCGVLNWGVTLGDFSADFPEWPHRSHYGIAAGMALMGPLGTVVTTLLSNFWQHGLVWK